MKLPLVFLAILLAAGPVPARAQGGKAHPSVDLGDFLWQGKYYRGAKASVADGTITVKSEKDGVFTVPVRTAPTDLRRKLALPDPEPIPKTETFPLFALSEADLGARYGAAAETGPSAMTPATKLAVYNVHGMRLGVHFLDGRSAVVMASRVGGKISQEEVDALLARCGTRWTDQGNDVFKSAEGAVAVRLEGMGILTVQSAAFLGKKGAVQRGK